MKRLIYLTLTIFLMQGTIAQNKPAYVLYDSKGKKVFYKKLIKKLSKKDVVLIGEFHNNPISHWLELEITKDCNKNRHLVMGAEMFEQDNQQALDEYLKGELSVKGLDSAARLWKNYPTDYAPLVNFAKENKIAFAATNIPRRYATLVSKKGFEALDTLSDEEKQWMAKLPVKYDPELPGYKKMTTMVEGHSNENMPKAQAIKDATMAYFIAKNFVPGKLFIHYNGSYHSENNEGIVWYLKQDRLILKVATVTTVTQKSLKRLSKENRGKADFIICVDEDMTNTY